MESAVSNASAPDLADDPLAAGLRDVRARIATAAARAVALPMR